MLPQELASHIEKHAKAVIGSQYSRLFVVHEPRVPQPMRNLLPGLRQPNARYGVKSVEAPSPLWYIDGVIDSADGTMMRQRVHVPGTAGIAGTVAVYGSATSIHDPYSHPQYNGEVDVDTRALGLYAVPVNDSRGRVIAIMEVAKPLALKSEAPAGEPLSQAYVEQDRHMLNRLNAFAASISMPLEYASAINRERTGAVLGNKSMMHRLFRAWQADQEKRVHTASKVLWETKDRLGVLRVKINTKAADDHDVRRSLKSASAAVHAADAAGELVVATVQPRRPQHSRSFRNVPASASRDEDGQHDETSELRTSANLDMLLRAAVSKDPGKPDDIELRGGGMPGAPVKEPPLEEGAAAAAAEGPGDGASTEEKVDLYVASEMYRVVALCKFLTVRVWRSQLL